MTELTGLIFFLQFTSQVDIIGASGCGSAVYNLMMHFAKRPKNCVSAAAGAEVTPAQLS